MWAGTEDPADIALYVMHMPRGGALGAWLGGASAVTAEEDMLRWVEHAVWASQSSKPKQMKPRDYPEGVQEQEQRIARIKQAARRFKNRRRTT
ncbi:hypothetical protein G7068_03295 [Leucobacter viscericola]|uniref:Uncharacterized protein n=1 Tax=Leucobacter viscericola TaxID=2714935 RepID=A0A6G7XCK6_9MICO|nr:hypothetical protein [Leucobacter viscericola]QIK62340.1 hypothetical protein G7068_03295 [Leucobacter viscericola]